VPREDEWRRKTKEGKRIERERERERENKGGF
jgi:hypothetical protein